MENFSEKKFGIRSVENNLYRNYLLKKYSVIYNVRNKSYDCSIGSFGNIDDVLGAIHLFDISSDSPSFANYENSIIKNKVFFINSKTRIKYIFISAIGVIFFLFNVWWQTRGQFGDNYLGLSEITKDIDNFFHGEVVEEKLFSHGKYTGQVIGSKANGIGKYQSNKSGVIYIGNFSNDKFSGFGTMFWPNGDVFIGDWDNDYGISGTEIFENGSISKGRVRIGVFSSDGLHSSSRLKSMGKGIFKGELFNGVANGYGIYISNASKISYYGHFSSNKFNGKGLMLWPDGSYYVGEWLDDSAVSGSMILKDGSIKVGTVVAGLFLTK
jgi:hypothetical protein